MGIKRDVLDKEKMNILEKIKESSGTALGVRSPSLETYWKIIEYTYEGNSIDF